MWSSRMFCLARRVRTAPSAFAAASSTMRPRNLNSSVVPRIATIERGFPPSGEDRSLRTLSFMNSAGRRLESSPMLHIMAKFMSFPFHETRRCMSKYLSKSAAKRLPLNTKRAKKGYYKGKGCTSEGRLTSKGKFIADPLKKLQLIVPDLEGFALKPYIARSISKTPPEKRTSPVAGA